MKKFTLSFLGVVLVLTAVYAASTQVKQTAAGYQLGTASDQKIGFWGVAPTNQLSVTIGGVSDAGRLTNLLNALRLSGIINTN